MGIGKIVKYLRTATDTSQARLAQELGITPGYLSLVESDKRQPSLPLLRSVADHFRVPVGFLLLDDTKLNGLRPKQRRLLQEIRRDLVDYIVERGFQAKTATNRSSRRQRQ
jgi:transcriptional regulator with XRE-family HTH domain